MENFWIGISISLAIVALVTVGIILFIKSSNRSASHRTETPWFPFDTRWFSFDKSKAKGKRGEMQVAACLNEIEGTDDFVLNDTILFNTTSGKTAQIDHIFFCASGIYVIETKSYAGLILGSENANEWTEVLSNGNVRNPFYSPIKQNNTHMYLVSKIIGKKYPVKGVVVFTDGDIRQIQCENVMSLPAFYQYMKCQTAKLLTPQQIRKAYELILLNKESYQVTEQEHIDNVRKTQTDIGNNICPRCGKSLVLRKGPYGEFYGCSGYPDCKFKKRLKN